MLYNWNLFAAQIGLKIPEKTHPRDMPKTQLLVDDFQTESLPNKGKPTFYFVKHKKRLSNQNNKIEMQDHTTNIIYNFALT